MNDQNADYQNQQTPNQLPKVVAVETVHQDPQNGNIQQQIPTTPQLTPFIPPPAQVLANNPSPAQLQIYAPIPMDQGQYYATQTPQINTLVVPTIQQQNQLSAPMQQQLVQTVSPQVPQIINTNQNTQDSNQSAVLSTNQAININQLQHQNPIHVQATQGGYQVIDNATLQAYFATMANPSITPGTSNIGNLVPIGSNLIMTPTGPQVVQSPHLILNNGLASMGATGTANPQTTGPRAYELLAVHQCRRSHSIRADSSRMHQLKEFKTKLMDKPLAPLNPRHTIDFMDLTKIPGWFSTKNKARISKWAIRWAEIFRQTLLLEIEAEMVKIMARRDLVIQDEQAGGTNFGLVSVVRSDLRICKFHKN